VLLLRLLRVLLRRRRLRLPLPLCLLLRLRLRRLSAALPAALPAVDGPSSASGDCFDVCLVQLCVRVRL
jgi:hypothetical protein